MDPNLRLPVNPITHVFDSQSLSVFEARKILNNYTTDALKDAALHPDCQLTSRGPVFPQEGIHSGAGVLELVRRIQSGMQGEALGGTESILMQLEDRVIAATTEEPHLEPLVGTSAGGWATEDMLDANVSEVPSLVVEKPSKSETQNMANLEKGREVTRKFSRKNAGSRLQNKTLDVN